MSDKTNSKTKKKNKTRTNTRYVRQMLHFNEQLHDGTFGEQKSEQDTVINVITKLHVGGKRHKQMTDRAMGTIHHIYIHQKIQLLSLPFIQKILSLMQISNFLVFPKEDSSSKTD